MATIRLGKIDPGDCDCRIGDFDFFGNLSISRNHNEGEYPYSYCGGLGARVPLRIAAKEFKTNGYKRLFTTGGPVEGLGGYVNDYQTAASVGAEGLVKAGVTADAVQMVPSHIIGRDRTYSSAVALRNWLHDNDVIVNSFNVLTEDTHARRTRLLFEEVFGGKVRVGVISIPDPDYDQRHWWRYSQGVKDVLSEGVAYIYAKFFFWPSAAESQSDLRSQRLEITGQRTEDGRRKGEPAKC